MLPYQTSRYSLQTISFAVNRLDKKLLSTPYNENPNTRYAISSGSFYAYNKNVSNTNGVTFVQIRKKEMPEGPSIVILKELMLPFKGKKIVDVKGNAKIDLGSLKGKKITELRSWGKQFFVCLPGATLRIHFLLFGTYSIGEQTKPDKSLRLGLFFTNGSIFFYTCSVKFVEGGLEELYDWEADTMSDRWNPAKARKKLKALPSTLVCDVLLDQQVFAGVGNIIKNEVLYRIRLHPETLVKNIPSRKISELIREARNYSFDFLKWKKEYVLKKHWLAHTKKICQRCDLPFIKKYCGKTKRRTFFCDNCQLKYA